MLLSAPAQGKDSSPIHGSSTRRGRHRCGHDGQRKCVAHMPTAATTTEDSRSKFGRKLPTRLHDEAIYILIQYVRAEIFPSFPYFPALPWNYPAQSLPPIRNGTTFSAI